MAPSAISSSPTAASSAMESPGKLASSATKLRRIPSTPPAASSLPASSTSTSTSANPVRPGRRPSPPAPPPPLPEDLPPSVAMPNTVPVNDSVEPHSVDPITRPPPLRQRLACRRRNRRQHGRPDHRLRSPQICRSRRRHRRRQAHPRRRHHVGASAPPPAPVCPSPSTPRTPACTGVLHERWPRRLPPRSPRHDRRSRSPASSSATSSSSRHLEARSAARPPPRPTRLHRRRARRTSAPLKNEGLPVTCEAAPHHFTLTDARGWATTTPTPR